MGTAMNDDRCLLFFRLEIFITTTMACGVTTLTERLSKQERRPNRFFVGRVCLLPSDGGHCICNVFGSDGIISGNESWVVVFYDRVSRARIESYRTASMTWRAYDTRHHHHQPQTTDNNIFGPHPFLIIDGYFHVYYCVGRPISVFPGKNLYFEIPSTRYK